MDICTCIADLLEIHDCVIIPGLGGFIGNNAPASIDPVHHYFIPPHKKVLFNVNVKQNDGLLVNAVSNHAGLSYADASALVERFSEECRQTLKSGFPCDFPNIGRLVPGKEGNILFEQDRKANLFPGSFGLVPFISPPISRATPILGVDPSVLVKAVRQPVMRLNVPRALKWAAILALPVGFALVIGLTQYGRFAGGNSSSANIAGTLFARFSSASLFETREAPAGTKIIKPKATPVPQPAATVQTVVKTPAIRQEDPFAVIVGAFRMKENAEKLVGQLRAKGMDAAIFDQSKGGLYRVTTGTTSDRGKAAGLLARVKSSDFRDAWLLAK